MAATMAQHRFARMDITIITRMPAHLTATTDRIGLLAACLLALARGFTGAAVIGAEDGAGVVGIAGAVGAEADSTAGAVDLTVDEADSTAGVVDSAAAVAALAGHEAARFTNTVGWAVEVDFTAELHAVDLAAVAEADSTVAAVAGSMVEAEAMAAATGN
jgi:hypothetical protein